MSEKLTEDDPHPWYGPCDGFGRLGQCSACLDVKKIKQPAWLRDRRFEFWFNYLGWTCWSLGVHVGIDGPHLDVHVPLGFFRIGWFYELREPLIATRWDLSWNQIMRVRP